MLFGVRLSFPELKNNIFTIWFSFLGSDLKGFVEISTVEYSQKMGKKNGFSRFCDFDSICSSEVGNGFLTIKNEFWGHCKVFLKFRTRWVEIFRKYWENWLFARNMSKIHFKSCFLACCDTGFPMGVTWGGLSANGLPALPHQAFWRCIGVMFATY